MAAAVTRTFTRSFKILFCPFSRQIGLSSCSVVHEVTSSPTLVAAKPVASYQTCFRRWQSTVSGTGDSTLDQGGGKETFDSWLAKAKKRSWLWRWMNDIDEIEQSIMSEEEYNEREKMVEKLMDRYFDTPDAKFDLDIFEEIFELLIKYNDREGVKMFWGLMKEMQVPPTEELKEQVETYLVKAREASWYE